MLSPTLFNIYTNDRPLGPHYSNNLALVAQHETFEAVEDTLNKRMERLDEYYKSNYLEPNPSETEICSFHLRNREARRELRVRWGKTEPNLEVTLDRTLTYEQHCEATKKKVAARTNIIRKEANEEPNHRF